MNREIDNYVDELILNYRKPSKDSDAGWCVYWGKIWERHLLALAALIIKHENYGTDDLFYNENGFIERMTVAMQEDMMHDFVSDIKKRIIEYYKGRMQKLFSDKVDLYLPMEE